MNYQKIEKQWSKQKHYFDCRVGDRLKRARKAKRWTLEITTRGICSVSTLSKAENHQIAMDDSTLRILCERLDVDYTQIKKIPRSSEAFQATVYEALIHFDVGALKELQCDYTDEPLSVPALIIAQAISLCELKGFESKHNAPLLMDHWQGMTPQEQTLTLMLQMMMHYHQHEFKEGYRVFQIIKEHLSEGTSSCALVDLYGGLCCEGVERLIEAREWLVKANDKLVMLSAKERLQGLTLLSIHQALNHHQDWALSTFSTLTYDTIYVRYRHLYIYLACRLSSDVHETFQEYRHQLSALCADRWYYRVHIYHAEQTGMLHPAVFKNVPTPYALEKVRYEAMQKEEWSAYVQQVCLPMAASSQSLDYIHHATQRLMAEAIASSRYKSALGHYKRQQRLVQKIVA